jgi:hypothetical protein
MDELLLEGWWWVVFIGFNVVLLMVWLLEVCLISGWCELDNGGLKKDESICIF